MSTSPLLQRCANKFRTVDERALGPITAFRIAWPYECKVVIIDLRLPIDAAHPTRLHFLEHYILRSNEDTLARIYNAGGTCNAFTTTAGMQFFFVLPAGYDLGVPEYLTKRCAPEAWRKEQRILAAELERYRGLKDPRVLGRASELAAVRVPHLEALRAQALRECVVVEADHSADERVWLDLPEVVAACCTNTTVAQRLSQRIYGAQWDPEDIGLVGRPVVQADFETALQLPFQLVQVLLELVRDGQA